MADRQAAAGTWAAILASFWLWASHPGGGYHYPRHLQALSRSGLRAGLARVGFDGIAVVSAPHLQMAISVQNWLVSRGWNLRMRYGKSRIYSALLLGVAPFELAAYAAGRSGIMNVRARKPPSMTR